MGYDKDEQSGVPDDFLEVSDRGQVFGKGNVGEVARVLVSSVDDVGELLAVHLGVSHVSWVMCEVRSGWKGSHLARRPRYPISCANSTSGKEPNLRASLAPTS